MRQMTLFMSEVQVLARHKVDYCWVKSDSPVKGEYNVPDYIWDAYILWCDNKQGGWPEYARRLFGMTFFEFLEKLLTEKEGKC